MTWAEPQCSPRFCNLGIQHFDCGTTQGWEDLAVLWGLRNLTRSVWFNGGVCRVKVPASVVEAMAGGLGEMAQILILYPLDTIKVCFLVAPFAKPDCNSSTRGSNVASAVCMHACTVQLAPLAPPICIALDVWVMTHES